MSELVLNFQLVLYKFTKMTTTSKPSFAVGQAADNLTAVLATDLVKGTKFKNLLKTITDNKDRAGVVYPVGMQPAFLLNNLNRQEHHKMMRWSLTW